MSETLSPEEHKQRHVLLHAYLDELIADFLSHTGNLPSKTNLMDFLIWTSQQAQEPTDVPFEHRTKYQAPEALLQWFADPTVELWAIGAEGQSLSEIGFWSQSEEKVRDTWNWMVEDGCLPQRDGTKLPVKLFKIRFTAASVEQVDE